jgi:hypothetical protein
MPVLRSRPFAALVASPVAALCLCLGCSGPGTTRYVGTVTNSGLPTSPGSLSLTLLSGTDTSFTGYLLIGPPLGGSGSAYGWFRGDTIKLFTVSETGDTILWLSRTRGHDPGRTLLHQRREVRPSGGRLECDTSARSCLDGRQAPYDTPVKLGRPLSDSWDPSHCGRFGSRLPLGSGSTPHRSGINISGGRARRTAEVGRQER